MRSLRLIKIEVVVNHTKDKSYVTTAATQNGQTLNPLFGDMPKHHWRVRIPYTHEFTVVAETREEAIGKAHSEEGVITGYDDSQAEVEIADEVFGVPADSSGDNMAKVFLQVGSQEAERDADGYYVFPVPKEGLKLYLQKADGSSTLHPSAGFKDSYICVTINRNGTVETGRT